MSDQVFVDKSTIVNRDYTISQNRLKKAMSELAEGKGLLRPGDDVREFDKVSTLKQDHLVTLARMGSLQLQMSWLQSTDSALENIKEVVHRMSELSIQAANPALNPQDIEVLDATFQEYKAQISSLVDGQSGKIGVDSTFNGLPLFTGFVPPLDLGPDAPATPAISSALNLYTGYGLEGFDSLPLRTQANSSSAPSATVSGLALAGSLSTLTLDDNAPAMDDVYNGLTVSITGGAGAGQTATIADYNGLTGVITFEAPLAVGLDNTSEYTITAGFANENYETVGHVSSLNVAHGIWGADNDRSLDDLDTFRSLTTSERSFRLANGIPDTDLEPKTYDEKILRRQLNIFDPEFGNLKTADNVERMGEQLQRVLDQLSQVMTHVDSRAEFALQQYNFLTESSRIQEEGIDQFESADFFRNSSELASLTVNIQQIMEIAARLTENRGMLNDLVRNKGKS